MTPARKEEIAAFLAMLAVCALLVLIGLLWPVQARAARWPGHDLQKRCFVELSTIRDARLRRRCERLSRKLP